MTASATAWTTASCPMTRLPPWAWARWWESWPRRRSFSFSPSRRRETGVPQSLRLPASLCPLLAQLLRTADDTVTEFIRWLLRGGPRP